MSGRRSYDAAHRRARAAMISQVTWGTTACCRCRHPFQPGDKMDADHRDDGPGYLGLAHRSPCQTCGKRCNQAAGGQLAAEMAGRETRDRRCLICGKPFHASMGNDGSLSSTCGNMKCVTALRRGRKNNEPDPEPPPPTGLVW